MPHDGNSSAEIPHFEGNLIGSDFQPNIKFIQERPNKVVRVAHPDPMEDETVGIVIQKYLRATPLFTELKDQYGIAIPDIKLATGSADGKNALLVETDMIYGDNLHNKSFTPEEGIEARPRLEHLCESLTAYLTKKYDDGEPFLSDIVGLGQFVYGRKDGDIADDIYLVDLHPRTTFFDKSHPGSTGNLHFVTNLQSQYRFITELEQKSGGTPFVKAREQLKTLIEKVPLDIPLPMLLSSARQGLGIVDSTGLAPAA